MKVTATMRPRRSPSDRRPPSAVVSVNLGAGPILESRPPSFALCVTASVDTVTTVSATEAASVTRWGTIYPFSSFLRSLMNRQSVPCAIIFCGLLLIIPTSWRRRE
jgi:hypothetical protein